MHIPGNISELKGENYISTVSCGTMGPRVKGTSAIRQNRMYSFQSKIQKKIQHSQFILPYLVMQVKVMKKVSVTSNAISLHL